MPTTRTWDVVIDDGTTALGFMLARGRNGQHAYQHRDTRLLPPIISEDALSESKAPPAIEGIWTEDDWSAGLGGTLHRKHKGQYAISIGADASTLGSVVLPPVYTTSTVDTNPTDARRCTSVFMYSTELWATMGREFYNWDFATDLRFEQALQTNVTEAAGDVWRNPTYFEGTVYLARYQNNTWTPRTYAYKSSTGADTWTASTLGAPNGFMCFAVADSKLWGGRTTANLNGVHSSTDGTNSGSWSGVTTVGDSNYTVNALLDYNGILLVCKGDGLFTIDASGTVATLIDLLLQGGAHTDHFKNAIMWNRRALLPLGSGGLWELGEDGRIQDISLRLVAPDETELHGHVVALASSPTRIYALVEDSDNNKMYVLFADYLEINGVADYRWHVLRDLDRNSTSAARWDNTLFVQNYNYTATTLYHRVWVGMSSTTSQDGNTTSFFPIDTNDTAFAYTASTGATARTFETVDFDAGYPEVTKEWQSIACETDGLGSGGTDHSIDVDYSTDHGATFTDIGTDLTQDNQSINFAAGTTSRLLRIRFTFVRGTTTTTTPELLRFTVTYQLRPAARKQHLFQFYIADGVVNKAGGYVQNAGQMLSQLRTWNTQAASVTVYDDAQPNGRRMILMADSMSEEIIHSEYGRRPEYRVRIRAVDVA